MIKLNISAKECIDFFMARLTLAEDYKFKSLKKEINKKLYLAIDNTEKIELLRNIFNEKRCELIRTENWDAYTPQNLHSFLFSEIQKEFNDPVFKVRCHDIMKAEGMNEYTVMTEFILDVSRVSYITSLHRLLQHLKTEISILQGADNRTTILSNKTVIEQAESSGLVWMKSDTDILELITSLIESGAINNKTLSVTRKEAIEAFEKLFNIQIKDAESKLVRASTRKRDQSPFLESLKHTFVQYCNKNNN